MSLISKWIIANFRKKEPHPEIRPFVESKNRMRRGASRRRAKGQVPRPTERQAFKCRVLLPEERHRIARVVAAPPVGIQVRGAIAQVAVHARHVLPRLLVVLGDVELIAGAVPRRPLVVVDGLDTLGEQPSQHETFVREGLGAAHQRDVRPLAVGREVVDHDPLDDRVVALVAVEEPQALHILSVVRGLGGEQEIPTPELGVDALDGSRVALEGECHTVISLAEADAERAVGILALGPRGGGLRETFEHVLADAPVARDVLNAEGSDLLLHGLLERVGVELRVERLDPPRHQIVVAEELQNRRERTPEAEEASDQFGCLIQIEIHRNTSQPSLTSPQECTVHLMNLAFVCGEWRSKA